jgi:NADP-dependent 3-hydroxy acid dehydrogenase YdfG
MIADRQFLSQLQVAQTVMALADDEISKILNGKVIPGDRVFYPVKPHIGTATPDAVQPSFASQVFVMAFDGTDKSDADRAQFVASHIEKNGGKAILLISDKTPQEIRSEIAKFHSHVVNLSNQDEVNRWLAAAKNMGRFAGLIYLTGNLAADTKIIDLTRKNWDGLVDKFVNTPATVIQAALEVFVPGGKKDPRLYKNATGTVAIIGPELPQGSKTTGADRARVEVFRGALRPFVTTANQELSDVLKSKIRIFLALPGSVEGKEPSNENIARAINYFVSDQSRESSLVTFCVDEKRE